MTDREKERILVVEFDRYKNTGHIHPYDESKGYTYRKEGVLGEICAEKMRYDVSWEWLMPVVEKIESITLPGDMVAVRVNIRGTVCEIFNGRWQEKSIAYEDDKLKSTFKAVVAFIKMCKQTV